MLACLLIAPVIVADAALITYAVRHRWFFWREADDQ